MRIRLVESCLWRTNVRAAPISDNLAKPDIVLAADCVYFEPAFPLLHETLLRLTGNGNVEVYMAYKKRRKVSSTKPPLICRRIGDFFKR